METVVRKLERNDLAKGFLETLSNLLPVGLTVKEAEGIFDEISINPLQHTLVVEYAGQVVSTATLLVEHKFLLKGTKFGHIENVATRKGFERRGYGSAVVRAAIEIGHQEGCSTLRLDCDGGNIPFYKKFEFEVKEVMMQLTLNYIKV